MKKIFRSCDKALVLNCLVSFNIMSITRFFFSLFLTESFSLILEEESIHPTKLVLIRDLNFVLFCIGHVWIKKVEQKNIKAFANNIWLNNIYLKR